MGDSCGFRDREDPGLSLEFLFGVDEEGQARLEHWLWDPC